LYVYIVFHTFAHRCVVIGTVNHCPQNNARLADDNCSAADDDNGSDDDDDKLMQLAMSESA